MPEELLFALKDITFTPVKPRMKEPFTVKGKIELFKIPFVLPIWVIAKVTYPKKWWEEIIPIIGSPTVGEGDIAIGSDFSITFPKGFDREGEFTLEVEAHVGPTFTIDKMTVPPFPPVDSEETTFIVAGERLPEEAGFSKFRIISYSKNGGAPVIPPDVLELEVGDRCRIRVAGEHRDGSVSGKYHAAIGNLHKVPIKWIDEVLNAEKTFSLPPSTDWKPFEDYVDIVITSAISPGSYSMYAKIMGITGGDIFTEYIENVITIVGVIKGILKVESLALS